MKTNVDINNLIQVPDTPLYQDRTTGEYFLREIDVANAYTPIPTEKIKILKKLGIYIPDVAAELESHTKPRRDPDERAEVNDTIRKIVKSNNRAQKYKSHRDLVEQYQKIAEQDISAGMHEL